MTLLGAGIFPTLYNRDRALLQLLIVEQTPPEPDLEHGLLLMSSPSPHCPELHICESEAAKLRKFGQKYPVLLFCPELSGLDSLLNQTRSFRLISASICEDLCLESRTLLNL